MIEIKNAKEAPQRYYGLHFAPGVAEYKEKEGALTIFVNEETIKKMDPTFTGKPVYVDHVLEVDLSEIKEADGFVVKSFYNAVDGKHWVEFLIISDKGHNAIRNGWRLSNAYVPKAYGNSGVWHGVDYQKEVTDGEYDHLAIVENPRYDESIILTPDEFKAYNERKESEIKRLTNSNSQKGDKSVLNIFKKTKIENEADFDKMMVSLPKSKTDKTLSEVVDIADKYLNMMGYADGDHRVKVGDEEMSVNELMDCYGKMKNAEKERMMKEEEMKNKSVADVDEDKEVPEKEEPQIGNTDTDMEGPEGGTDAKDKTKQNSVSYIDRLKNAEKDAKQPAAQVNLGGVERGKKKYGSN